MLNLQYMGRLTGDKKTEPITIKAEAADKTELLRIGDLEDRPLGYVARELMLRGMAAYKRDGLLREPSVQQGQKTGLDRETERRQAEDRLVVAEAEALPSPPKRKGRTTGTHDR